MDTQADIIAIDKYLLGAPKEIREAFNRLLEKIYKYSGDSRELYLYKRKELRNEIPFR